MGAPLMGLSRANKVVNRTGCRRAGKQGGSLTSHLRCLILSGPSAAKAGLHVEELAMLRAQRVSHRCAILAHKCALKDRGHNWKSGNLRFSAWPKCEAEGGGGCGVVSLRSGGLRSGGQPVRQDEGKPTGGDKKEVTV
jgi:hypothetical protein